MAFTYAFLGWSNFVDHLNTDGLCLLLGSKGTGKTLTATAMGYHLLRLGQALSFSCNYPCTFASAPSKRWTVGVLDEAGLVFDSRFTYRDKAKSLLSARSTAFLRKDGSYLFVASVVTPDKQLRAGVRMYRVFPSVNSKSFWNRYLWLFRWERGPEDRMEQKKNLNYFSGFLALLNPAYFFGTYDTYFAPSPELTVDYLTQFVNNDTDVTPYLHLVDGSFLATQGGDSDDA